MSNCRRLAAMLLAGISVGALAEPSFVPVYPHNFPDPFVLNNGGEFIAYATNDGINLPMLASRDLIHWAPVGDPASPTNLLDGMPILAPWVKPGFTWAPEVMKVGSRWLLYYTANHRKTDVQCIGVAVASDPRGPFRDTSAEPLVCQYKLGGTIDANPFRDADGKLYIYYKSDGNRIRKGTGIWGQELAADGLSVVGPAVEISKDDQKWEMRVVEAPTMVRTPTGYTLLYSAGYYGWNAEDRLSPYAMGYAICSGPLGPCQDGPDNPIVHSFKEQEAGCLSGPGHQSVFEAGGRSYITFHAWAASSGCRKLEDQRYLYVAPVGWKDGKPQIAPSLRP
ncbi:MAG: glycoside hydrolase family 43 protein [Sphingomicrobium sp.]